ncbi:MAG: GNAT family N-acetyltransferase [Bryobacteraceae bacterium]
MPIEVRRLARDDAAALWALRLEALESVPEAFAESAEEHRRTSVEALAARLRSGTDENFVLGGFSDAALIGMVGFYRELRVKRRHTGGIWGMFVQAPYRGSGTGRALLTAALTRARALHGLDSVHLSVATSQLAARSMYLRLGFRPFGLEPRALLVAGEFVDEEHLVIELHGSPKPPLRNAPR